MALRQVRVQYSWYHRPKPRANKDTFECKQIAHNNQYYTYVLLTDHSDKKEGRS